MGIWDLRKNKEAMKLDWNKFELREKNRRKRRIKREATFFKWWPYIAVNATFQQGYYERKVVSVMFSLCFVFLIIRDGAKIRERDSDSIYKRDGTKWFWQTSCPA